MREQKDRQTDGRTEIVALFLWMTTASALTLTPLWRSSFITFILVSQCVASESWGAPAVVLVCYIYPLGDLMHLKTSRCKSPDLSAKVLEHNFFGKVTFNSWRMQDIFRSAGKIIILLPMWLWEVKDITKQDTDVLITYWPKWPVKLGEMGCNTILNSAHFHFPTCQIWHPGQWHYSSSFGAVGTLLVSFLEAPL